MRYLQVFIYSEGEQDCTLNGVTAIKNRKGKVFVVPCEKGYFDEDEIISNSRFVVLDIQRRNIGGSEYINLRPSCAGNSWTMMGGNFAYSSDSRFREISQYPLPIHDRIEG